MLPPTNDGMGSGADKAGDACMGDAAGMKHSGGRKRELTDRAVAGPAPRLFPCTTGCSCVRPGEKSTGVQANTDPDHSNTPTDPAQPEVP